MLSHLMWELREGLVNDIVCDISLNNRASWSNILRKHRQSDLTESIVNSKSNIQLIFIFWEIKPKVTEKLKIYIKNVTCQKCD